MWINGNECDEISNQALIDAPSTWKSPLNAPFHINFAFFSLPVARTSQTFFIPPISVSLLLNLCLYFTSYFGFKKLQKIKISTFLTLQLKKCAELNKSSRSSIAHMEKVGTMWVLPALRPFNVFYGRKMCRLTFPLDMLKWRKKSSLVLRAEIYELSGFRVNEVLSRSKLKYWHQHLFFSLIVSAWRAQRSWQSLWRLIGFSK